MLEEIFGQTIDRDTKYQVFLQKYGEGELYVSERNYNYFIVKGTKDLSFGWELKAVQRDFDSMRLEQHTASHKDTSQEINDIFNYNNILDSDNTDMITSYIESINGNTSNILEYISNINESDNDSIDNYLKQLLNSTTEE